MKKLTKIIALLMTAGLLLSGCTKNGTTETTTAVPSDTTTTQQEDQTSEADTTESDTGLQKSGYTFDRAGNEISIPENVEKIVSLNPAITETLVDMGLADKIIAVDDYSQTAVASYTDSIPVFSMYEPDHEQLIALEPDVIFTSGMVYAGGDNPYVTEEEAGICVVDIPSSASIADIQEDIRFIGEVTGEQDKAEAIVSDMQAKVDEIIEDAKSIPDDEKKTVLFLLSVPTDDYSSIYSIGSGTFLNEMLEDVGAVNVTGSEEGWPEISEEAAVALNPDVILHSVSYVDDVKGAITSRKGWENVTAVKNGDIYYIDENSSNRPNAHIVDAMVEMAKTLYPDYFGSIKQL